MYLNASRHGQLVFKLAASDSYAATALRSVSTIQASQGNKTVQSNKTIQTNRALKSKNITHDVVRFERGLFTERECTKLDPAVRLLQIGKTVRITPLAADSLRHRGISTQRAES